MDSTTDFVERNPARPKADSPDGWGTVHRSLAYVLDTTPTGTMGAPCPWPHPRIRALAVVWWARPMPDGSERRYAVCRHHGRQLVLFFGGHLLLKVATRTGRVTYRSNQQKAERNRALIEAATTLPYRTLEELGREFGLTRERVRQVIARWCQPERDALRQQAHDERDAEVRRIRARRKCHLCSKVFANLSERRKHYGADHPGTRSPAIAARDDAYVADVLAHPEEAAYVIAARHGIRHMSAYAILRKRGVYRRGPLEDVAKRDLEVLARYEAGEPMREITKEAGLSGVNTTWQNIRRAVALRQVQPLTPEQETYAREMLATSLGPMEVAKIMGVSPMLIRELSGPRNVNREFRTCVQCGMLYEAGDYDQHWRAVGHPYRVRAE